MINTVLSWLTGGALSRVFDTIDKSIESQTDRERLKADVIKEHMRTRSDWLRAGGLFLMIPFVGVVFFHFGAVAVYSVFWCADCMAPQGWTIAALPEPMATWEGWIIAASIGGLSLMRMKR